jgi:hypothetical protein
MFSLLQMKMGHNKAAPGNSNNNNNNNNNNPVAIVREQTITTERPPLLGEFTANFCR